MTFCPGVDGSGLSEVIDVEVSALSTVCASVEEVLPLKLLSPAYVAVSDFALALVNEIVHCPAATDALHDCVPSLTVTEPVGVPAPGEVTATP